jgi:hypothetical protein
MVIYTLHYQKYYRTSVIITKMEEIVQHVASLVVVYAFGETVIQYLFPNSTPVDAYNEKLHDAVAFSKDAEKQIRNLDDQLTEELMNYELDSLDEGNLY